MADDGGERELACGGCSGAAAGSAGGRREPFAFPGTTKKYARDRVVDVRHVRLDIAVDPEQRRIAGTARHTVAAIAAGCERVVLDAAELTVEGVTDGDGKELRFEHVDGVLTVHLRAALGDTETTDVVVAYRGSPRRGLYFVGPDEGYPDKPVQAWTQGQDEDSRYWFPCFDYPNEKATTEVVVTVPSKYTTLSNGALVEKRAGAKKGTTTWHWRMAIPQVAYLVTLAVGEFEEVSLGEAGERNVPITALVPKGQGKDVPRSLGRTPEMVKAFEARFGVPYPYEKYAQVVVADFIFGGMENTTATTLTEYALYDERAALDYDADDLVAHELAHQWWGDLLTCRDWSHAWLNEGFATWCETVFREHRLGPDEATWHAIQASKLYFAEDSGEYRRAIVCKEYEEPIDVFDRHLYQKASWVIRALRAELGEDAFWAAIRRYAHDYQGATVVTDDLRRSIEIATGRNLESFFDQWIYGPGHPEFKASWSFDEKTGVLTVRVEQTQKAENGTPDAFRGTLVVEIATGEKAERRRLALTERVHAFHVPFPSRPDVVRFDPDATWLAPWTLDVGLDAHRKSLASDPTIAGRLRAAAALGKDSSAETVAALARAVKGDAFYGVQIDAASALAEIRTPAAREALLAVRKDVKHPKARRGVMAALGAFRGDEAAAEALREVVEKGDASMFVEAEAAESLGKTRVPFARTVLERALATKSSWSETIRAACVRGLGHLASEDVVGTLAKELAWGRHPRVRIAAAGALAEVGARLVARDGIREHLEALVDDRDFRVQMAGIAALRGLGDERAVPALRRGAEQGIDGRVKRACKATARRLEQRADRTAEVSKLSDAVETLRRQVAALEDRVRKSDAAASSGEGTAGPPSPRRGLSKRAAKGTAKPPPPTRKKRR